MKNEATRKLNYDYDFENDVLYISIGTPKPAYGEGEPSVGIIVRRDLKTDEIVGLTIIGFKNSIEKKWLFKYQDNIPLIFPKKFLLKIYKSITTENLKRID